MTLFKACSDFYPRAVDRYRSELLIFVTQYYFFRCCVVQYVLNGCAHMVGSSRSVGQAEVRRGQLKCDGTRSETRFCLSAKRTSPFKSAGTSVQSTAGSRGVRISGSNAGYTTFRGSVKGSGYPLHSPVSPSLPLPCVTVCHHISSLNTSCHVLYARTRVLLSTKAGWNRWAFRMHVQEISS